MFPKKPSFPYWSVIPTVWGGRKTNSQKSQADLLILSDGGEEEVPEGPSTEIPVNVGPDNKGT